MTTARTKNRIILAACILVLAFLFMASSSWWINRTVESAIHTSQNYVWQELANRHLTLVIHKNTTTYREHANATFLTCDTNKPNILFVDASSIGIFDGFVNIEFNERGAISDVHSQVNGPWNAPDQALNDGVIQGIKRLQLMMLDGMRISSLACHWLKKANKQLQKEEVPASNTQAIHDVFFYGYTSNERQSLLAAKIHRSTSTTTPTQIIGISLNLAQDTDIERSQAHYTSILDILKTI